MTYIKNKKASGEPQVGENREQNPDVKKLTR